MSFAKKLLSLGLCAALTVSCFTGCGDKKGEVVDGREPVTLTVFSELANYSGLQSGWSAAVLKDKFNVELNIIPGSDGTYETRVESGNLGDIVVFGSDGEHYQNAVKLGLLYDWEEDDLLGEYGAYIKEHMGPALENNRKISGGDKIYGFGHSVAPSAGSHESFFYTWDLRWDLYKKIGYPQVKNLDDLVEVLAQMQAAEPTDEAGEPTYAMSLWPDWDGNMVMYVKAMATAYFGYDEMGLGLYDSKTGKFHGALEEGGPYMTTLRFFNKLFQKNLIDPDSMTQTYDAMTEKLKNGGALFSIFNYAGSESYNTEEHLKNGKMMYTLVPDEASAPAYGMSVYGGNRLWTIGAKSEYPERCMEVINWLCTPEGAMNIWYGPKGLMWDYNADGYIEFTELGKTCNQDPSHDMSGVKWTSEESGKTYDLTGSFNDGMIQINNVTWSISAQNLDSTKGETYDYKTWKTELESVPSDIKKDWEDHMGVGTAAEYLDKTNYTVIPAAPGYSETVRTGELKVTWEQVSKCIVQYSWKAIYAKSDAEFDYLVKEMIRMCKSYGYEDCLKWCDDEAALKFSLQK